MSEPPDDLLCMSALGYTAREAFTAALEACAEHKVKLLILDSLGPALQGDAEASKDVITFFSQAMEPFRAVGVGVLIIDHQSKLQAGQSYQSKGAFGSVYKTNLARSVIQVEATERGKGMLTVRLRQKKHNFGPLAEPFGAKLTFIEDSVTLEPVELGAAELAEEVTLNATDRVKLALEQGPAYPWEIAEFTGLAVKTVKNTLTGLRKQGVVEATGETEGRTEEVTLNVPASLTHIRDGDAGTLENDQEPSVPTSRPLFRDGNKWQPQAEPSSGSMSEDNVYPRDETARRLTDEESEHLFTIEKVLRIFKYRSHYGHDAARARDAYLKEKNEDRFEALCRTVLIAAGKDPRRWEEYTAEVLQATLLSEEDGSERR